MKPYNISKLALGVAMAIATQAATAQTDNGAASLEEIIVTVQKKEERLQKAPVAVTAITNKEIEKKSIKTIEDISKYTAALTAETSPAGNGIQMLGMRGMTYIDVQVSGESPVGIYVNGVFVPRNISLGLDFADLNSVEVMRGPQGTLYGKNTTAGALNIYTKPPQDDFGGKIQQTFGSNGLSKTKLSLETGRYNGFSARGTVGMLTDDGTIKNNMVDWNLDKKDRSNFSFDIDYKGIEDFYARYNIDHTEIDESVAPLQLVQMNPFASQYLQALGYPKGLADTLVDQMTSQSSHHNLHRVNTPAPPDTTKNTSTGQSLELSKTFSDGSKLKSITGYRSVEMDYGAEFTNGFASAPPIIPVYRELYAKYDNGMSMGSDFLSEEINYLGTARGGKDDYVLGLYLSTEDAFDRLLLNYATDAVVLRNYESDIKTDTQAIFGQYTYRPDWNWAQDRLSVIAGVRYTQEQKEADRTALPTIFNGGTTTRLTDSADYSNTSGTLMAQWDFSAQTMGYIKASQAYKSGGFTSSIGSTAPIYRNPFEEETAITYEAGLKTDTCGGKCRINAAVYSSNYDNMQVQIALPNQFDPSDRAVINAGSVVINGLELDSTFLLTDHFSVNGGFAYTDVEFKKLDDMYGVAGVPGGDIADQYAMPLTPKTKGFISGTYSFNPTNFGTPNITAEYVYTGKMAQFYWQGNPQYTGMNTDTDSYGVFNLYASLNDIPVSKNTSLSAVAWVKNVTDEEYVMMKSVTLPMGVSGQFGPERTVGIDITYKF